MDRLQVSMERPAECDDASTTFAKLDIAPAGDGIEASSSSTNDPVSNAPLLTFSLADLPPPAEISTASNTIQQLNYPPPPPDFQTPRESLDTTITIMSPVEDSSDSVACDDSSEPDSDVCCLNFLKKRKDSRPTQDSYHRNRDLESPVVQQPKNLLQVPYLSNAEAARERIRQIRIQHYRETHGGFELSLDPNPRSRNLPRNLDLSSGSRSPPHIIIEQATPSPRQQWQNVSLKRRTKSVPSLVAPISQNWQQAPCSCMRPLLMQHSPLNSPRSPSMHPSWPGSAQPSLVHRNYITHDPHDCEICFAMSTKNPSAETRYCVQLTGYPLFPSPTVTYSTVINKCYEYEGYRSLFVAPYHRNTLYAEYFTLQCARAAVTGLNGFRITEEHMLRAALVPLPYNAQKVTMAAHL